MTQVTLAMKWTEAYTKFLNDNNVYALVSMDSKDETTTFTIKAEDELRLRGKWNPSLYAEYVL